MVNDLELKGIGNFTGTQQYYKGFLGTNYTEGVAYITNNGYSWFVTDSLSVIKTQEKFKQEGFITIKLKLLEGSKAQMIITDGNEKILYTQDYKYTNAKRELTLYFIDNVLLLANEY